MEAKLHVSPRVYQTHRDGLFVDADDASDENGVHSPMRVLEFDAIAHFKIFKINSHTYLSLYQRYASV